MTHAEQILRAVSLLTEIENDRIFSRNEVRQQASVSRENWDTGYSAIFQGMREDHPGGAPAVGKKFASVFQRVSHGKYRLTEYGQRIAKEMKDGGQETKARNAN